MKSINSIFKWILFVPVCLMSVVITLFNGLMPGTVPDFFATDQNGIAGIIAFSVLGLFIVCFLLSLFDRKTSPVHLLKKNYFCGIVAIASAIAMAGCAAYEFTQMLNSGSFEIMTALTALFTAIGGVTMLYLGLNHFSGANTPKNISILYLSLPVWCGVHLIDRFLKHTASPVAAADTMDLIMFVAMAMFFINATMVHSLIPGKNAVKATVNFGFPTVTVALVYGLSLAFEALNSNTFDFLSLFPSFVYILLALYALGITVELSFFSKTVEEQIIIEDEVSEDDAFADEYYSDEETEDSEETVELQVDSEEIFYEETYEEFEDDESSDVGDENTQEMADELAEASAPAKVRIADDTEESDTDDSSADDLFNAAKLSDKNADNNTIGSDNSVILDDNIGAVMPVKVSSGNSEHKPKGPTTREAIMYEDEDFILSVDTAEQNEPEFDKDEDISAFILDKQDDVRDNKENKISYEERLDEIDKLIISLQSDDTTGSSK